MLQLTDPQTKVDELVAFIKHTFEENNKTHAVVAVSGGIDSALSLSLTVMALGAENVTPVLLPYDQQSVEDSELILQHHHISESQWVKVNIRNAVNTVCEQLQLSPKTKDPQEKIRVGNIMARQRMVVVYDTAKSLNALVCGTENKSEHYLGYFTRFGDAASDLEPIASLYKTQVRQLAEFLQLPPQFLTKAPSAGLWEDQTDETEMGFSYEQADQVLHYLIDEAFKPEEIVIEGVSDSTVKKVTSQVAAMRFKLNVPYML